MKIKQLLLLGSMFLSYRADAQTPQVQGIPHEKGKVAVAASKAAVEYVDWVDWDQIQYWAGDPNGENKCALVIDFQDTEDERAIVWGYRWNGTATGEDLVRAVAGQSSCLTAMIQYTGTMGSTLNGLGISVNREHLDYLSYDFDAAAISGEVSFGYFDPNTSMGQEVAPGHEAEAMCRSAIVRARHTGIIEHPLSAFLYGYPAYDYDYWKLDPQYYSYDYRWKAGWYDGYWSYWHGPNDYDYMGYSGLGMSSTVLYDGCVQAWKYISFNGQDIGYYGGELAEELDYQFDLYEEEMHEIDPINQPVDQSKVNFWVGSGEKSATVVFQFNDGKGPENLVYGYRWSGGWDDNLNTVIKNIAAADPRMNLTEEGSNLTIAYDNNADGEFGDPSDRSLSGSWLAFVKRVIDDDFNRVPTGRWLNPNAVMILSRQPEADLATATVSLPYKLYRPALSDEASVTIPEEISYHIADEVIQVPLFLQAPAGGSFASCISNLPAEIKAVVTSLSFKTTTWMGTISKYRNFKEVTGKVTVSGTYKAPGAAKSEKIKSNELTLSLLNPVRPITSIRYEHDAVDARLGHPVDNKLIIEPANATYTKIDYKSSKPMVALVTNGNVSTTTTAGEAVITATYDLDANIKASYNITSSLKEPVRDISFEGVDENGDIVLTPKEMLGLLPVFTPADPDIQTFKMEMRDNVTGNNDYIATAYQVNLWDETNTRKTMYELSGHRYGECSIHLSANDGSGFEKDIKVRVVEPERSPVIDYNTGTIMLNEEWYGHTNGGLNWYSPDYEITYQAYERENPGMSFGCTSQYGIIYDGKLIVCSKQAADAGDPLPGGGRVVVADASTLKRIGSVDDLKWGDENRSMDGRAAVGAGHGRAYIGTNAGIYILDLEKVEIVGKIDGTGKDGGGDLTPGNPNGDLYQGQVGDMILAGKHVFAICQDKGVFIIDIDSDTLVKFIEEKNVQGITQSADGNVWYATLSDNKKQSIFVALNHNGLDEVGRVEVPAEYGAVTCGWGAWRTTQFTGAHSRNSLFFCPGSSITNGGDGVIYRYDIDDNKFTRLAQVSGLPAHTPGLTQGAYGTIRYDDRSGEIIAGTTEFKASGHYRWNWTHFIDAETGEFNRTIELRPYYWFQAHAIFPDVYSPEVEDIDDVVLYIDDEPVELEINATDRDNNDANICYSLVSHPVTLAETHETPVVDVALQGNKLTITPKAVGTHTVALAIESNGKVINHAVNVEVKDASTGIDDVCAGNAGIMTRGRDIIISGCAGAEFRVVNVAGVVVDRFTAPTDNYMRATALGDGVYIVIGDNGISKKIIVK